MFSVIKRGIRRHAFARNIWPLAIGTSACAEEFMAAWQECREFCATYCLAGFTPEQADILIVYGHVNRVMLPLVLDIYQRMPETKKVLLVGSQTFDQSLFKNAYRGGLYLTDYFEADVTVPGDPPSRADILSGFREVSRMFYLELAK